MNTLEIQIDHFGFDKKEKVLKNIYLTISTPKIIGLVAPNGVGKSTLIDIISGNLLSKHAVICFNGKNYMHHRCLLKKCINKMLEPLDLVDVLSGRDHLNLYASMWNKSQKRVLEVIHLLHIEHYVDKKVNTYSLGMRQRLCFALCLLTDADVLLLDEVMNGLDPTNVYIVSSLLRELTQQGKIIFLASHLLENLDQVADELLFLKEQTIFLTITPSTSTVELMQLEYIEKEPLCRRLHEWHVSFQLQEEAKIVSISLEQLSSEEQQRLLSRLCAHLHLIKRWIVGKKTARYIYHQLYLGGGDDVSISSEMFARK